MRIDRVGVEGAVDVASEEEPATESKEEGGPLVVGGPQLQGDRHVSLHVDGGIGRETRGGAAWEVAASRAGGRGDGVRRGREGEWFSGHGAWKAEGITRERR